MSDNAHIWRLLYLLLALLPLLPDTAGAQSQRRNVEGTVLDTARQALEGVSVRLTSRVDTLITVTDEDGKFTFSGVLSREFKLTFSMLGFRVFEQNYLVEADYNVLHILPVVIYPMRTLLDEVQISRIQPFTIRGDTVQYNMEAYNFSRNTLLEGALRSLPNIQVMRDGTVIAFGKRVNRVQVDGKNFFGGDVLTATRNLHAEIIKSLQVIDYYGDVAQATGIQSGESEKILNIVLHEDKKKILFGQVTGGGGTKERYIGSAGINNFNDGQELSVVASTNNTNTSLFSYGSPSGAGGRDRDGADLTGMTDPLDGLNQINSLGMSFSDQMTDHIGVYGKYSFIHRKNATISDLFLQSGFQNYLVENLERKEAATNQRAHSMSWDLEADFGPGSYLKISPTLSYTTAEHQINSIKTIKNRRVTTEGEYGTDGLSSNPNFGTDMILVKSFPKPGRKLVVNGNFEFFRMDRSDQIGDYLVIIDSSYVQPNIDIYSLLQKSDNDNHNRSGKMRAAFVEPVGKKGVFEFSYEYESTAIANNRQVWDVEEAHNIDSLGIDYHYVFQSNRYGATYQVEQSKSLKYTFGLAAQPLILEGFTMDNTIRTRHRHLNWVPSASLRYKWGVASELALDYLGSHNQPSFTQMQPVRDLSNSQHIIIGNADLSAEFVNRLTTRYRTSKMSSGSYFEAQFAYSTVKDKIVSNRRTSAGTTAIETTFLNADGYYDLRSYYIFSTMLGSDKVQFNLNGNMDYIHNISFTNDLRNASTHLIYAQAAQIRYSLPDRLNLEINGNYTLNRSQSPLYTFSDIRANTWLFGVAGKGYLNDHLSLGFDLSHRTNSGYSSYVNSNPTLFNSYIEYTFLDNDRALLRLQGFDIFNQNTGVTKEVYDTMDLSVRNNRLGRHFMLSLNIRLQRLPQG